jgi:toxin YoeB
MEFLWKKSVKSLEFDPAAFQDLAWWVEQDRKKALKIMKLIEAVQREPFTGAGQPEILKHDLAGRWSRRIDQEHRLVYEVSEEKIRILSCRYHY